MKVLLTGATGFVGRHVLADLLARGHHVHAIARTPPSPTPDPTPGVHYFQGDLASAVLNTAAAGCDAAIHLVGIIRETPPQTFRSVHTDGTRALLAACHAGGARRLVHMSALGTRANAVSEYHRSKWDAEQLVRTSGLDWTIFRPSMITGADCEFVRMVRSWAEGKAAPWLFFPYFRAGVLGLGRHSLVQPVAVTDVARAFVDALDRPASVGQTYDLAGPTPFTWPDFYQLLARHFRFPSRPALPIPIWYAKLLAHVLPAALLPFNLSQVQMAAENNTSTDPAFPQTFGWTPKAVE